MTKLTVEQAKEILRKKQAKEVMSDNEKRLIAEALKVVASSWANQVP